MTRQEFSTVDWDLLLDGDLRSVDLEAIGFAGGVPDFRALVYYQAGKRRGTVATRKTGPAALTVQATGCRPLATKQPTPKAFTFPQPQAQPPVRSEHVLDPADYMLDFDEDEEREAERLLGPCTCGKAPYCLPSCARA